MDTLPDATPTPSQGHEWDAARLAEAALAGEPRESLGLMLRAVSDMCGALGCIMWRATADAEPTAEPPIGSLSMVAGWFNTKISPQVLAIRRLPFDQGSIAGRAVRIVKPIWSNDLAADNNPNSSQPFFTTHNITRTLAAPFRFANERQGAVNIYRRETASPFQHADAVRLTRVAKLLPHLYRAVRQRASFDLLRQVGEILRDKRQHLESVADAKLLQKDILKHICDALQQMFQAVEVSVFLEAEDQPNVFRCSHTTEGPHVKATQNQPYQAGYDHGFSGLSLLTGQGIRIYDTQDCEDQIQEIRKLHPEFGGHKSRNLSDQAHAWLHVPEGWKPQPYSLIIAPLSNGQQTYGFLRCWIARKGPPFFSTDDLELLQLVAQQCAHTVERWREEVGIKTTLAKAKKEAHTAKADSLRVQQQHKVTLENIHHQMKGPLAEAKNRLDDILEDPRHATPSDLYAVRSMLHRASMMSKKIGWLSKLDEGERLSVQTVKLNPVEIARLVAEICQNNQFRVSAKRNIKIDLDIDTITAPAAELRANVDLLAEAFNNLVDNAVKYSFPNTRIKVIGGQSRGGRFYLSVSNIGVPIKPHEVALCRQRTWRGVAAERNTGEGSGIGLWIADNIMKTFGGELQIIISRENENFTEVRLAFSSELI